MQNDYANLTLLSIDAWRDGDGWTWNAWYTLEKGIIMGADEITPRKICKFLRDSGFLSESSKGKVCVDMHNEIVDGYLIEVLDKSTREPVFALSNIH